MMNLDNIGISGNEIEKYFKHKKNFKGCFPVNKIPYFKKLPVYLIINTDKSNQKGSHWLGLIIQKKNMFYFDSYGIEIIEPCLINYVKNYKNIKKIVYSNVCIQNLYSISCGLFASAFIKNVYNHKTFSKFLKMFDIVYTERNDYIVKYML
jgi:hypothetical protein